MVANTNPEVGTTPADMPPPITLPSDATHYDQSTKSYSRFVVAFHTWGFKYMHYGFMLIGVANIATSIAYMVLAVRYFYVFGIAISLVCILSDYAANRRFVNYSPWYWYTIVSDLICIAAVGVFIWYNIDFWQFAFVDYKNLVLDNSSIQIFTVGRAMYVLTCMLGAARLISAIVSVILLCTTMRGAFHKRPPPPELWKTETVPGVVPVSEVPV